MVTSIATHRQSKSLRGQLVQLASNAEQAILQLGEKLYQMYYAELDGPSYWAQWGYGTFAEYCERELGLTEFEALSHIDIYRYFGMQMSDHVDSNLLQAPGMSWRKLRVLMQLSSKKNVNSQLKRAANMRITDLEAEVTPTRTHRSPKSLEEKLAAALRRDIVWTAHMREAEHRDLMRAFEMMRQLHGPMTHGEFLARVSEEILERNNVKKLRRTA